MVTSVTSAAAGSSLAAQPAGGTYVGEDRRSNPVPGEPFRLGVLAMSVATLVVAWGALVWAQTHEAHLPDGLDADGVTRLFTVVTAVLATVAGLLAFVRWRLIGEASSLWVGTGILAFGVVTVGTADLLPSVYPAAADTEFLLALRPASRVLAISALLIGALGPAVDTRLRPWKVLAWVTGAILAMAAAVHVVPGAASSLRSTEGRAAFAVLWALVAAAHVVAAQRRGRRHHLAAAVIALGFALSELATATAVGLDVEPGPGPVFLAALTVALVLVGSTRELEAAFVAQRAEILDQALATELEQAKRRAEHAAHEERVHDARNAILAIDGAAQTLERFRDRLAPDQREALSHAVSEEIRRLQRLIEVDWEQEECRPFSVADLIAPIGVTERARGMRLEIDVPAGLEAVGRSADTAEVLRNLLDNARRYAPGSPVLVRAEADQEWAVVRVEDRGRGVAREEREAIFDRGQRGRAATEMPGSGLGLFVSRRLMRDQGGDMWAENRDGGGASFGLCLPLAASPPQAPDESTAAPSTPVHGVHEVTGHREEVRS